MSAGVYRRLTGNILVLGDTLSSAGLKGRIPRPLVVVHSGKIAIVAPGFSATSAESEVSFAPRGGVGSGGSSARTIAWKSVMRCTRRVLGYEAVKMGSKIAAR